MTDAFAFVAAAGGVCAVPDALGPVATTFGVLTMTDAFAAAGVFGATLIAGVGGVEGAEGRSASSCRST
jgi:hypothetical protein